MKVYVKTKMGSIYLHTVTLVYIIKLSNTDYIKTLMLFYKNKDNNLC